MNIQSLLQTVKALRTPDGCPWDREQTHKSLRKYLIEEAYEVLDQLDKIENTESLKNSPTLQASLQEELGDLLFQVLLHAELASENSPVNFSTIAQSLEEKLIRRHPHVFSDKKNLSKEEVSKQWEQTKAQEKTRKSTLEEIPSSLPALQKAEKIIERVSKVGFQWPNLDGPLEKVAEELGELAAEIEVWKKISSQKNNDALIKQQKQKIEAELGDMFFSLCNVAYFLKVDPENALRSMLKRFESRFNFVEKSITNQGKSLKNSSLEEMDYFWKKAKEQEHT